MLSLYVALPRKYTRNRKQDEDRWLTCWVDRFNMNINYIYYRVNINVNARARSK